MKEIKLSRLIKIVKIEDKTKWHPEYVTEKIFCERESVVFITYDPKHQPEISKYCGV